MNLTKESKKLPHTQIRLCALKTTYKIETKSMNLHEPKKPAIINESHKEHYSITSRVTGNTINGIYILTLATCCCLFVCFCVLFLQLSGNIFHFILFYLHLFAVILDYVQIVSHRIKLKRIRN